MLNIEEIEKIPFVFIVARGRSGTTLLQNILDSNKNIVLPIESRLIIHLKQKYFKIEKWTTEVIEEFIIDLYKDNKFNRYWNVSKERLAATIEATPLEQINFQLLCKIIYLQYPSPHPKNNITLIGDKNPIYSLFISELREVFPEAKFIHLIRDYRDNIVSNIKTFNFERLPVLAQGWLAYNKCIEQEKNKSPKLFYTLRYEDLASEPEKYVADLCSFLNIDYSVEMLNFRKKVKEEVISGLNENTKQEIDAVHPNILKPINTSQVNKWEGFFNDYQLELIESIAGNYGKKYKFHPSKKISTKLSIKLVATWGLIHQKFNFLIIRNYYKLPFFIRDFMRRLSLFLYEKFKYSNYFNNADFRFKGNPSEE